MNKFLRFFSVLIAMFLPSAASYSESHLITTPALSLALAKTIASTCEQVQIDHQRPPVAIAIFDQGANLVLFHRMEGVTVGASHVALAKGKSAALFAISTRQLGELSHGKNGVPAIAYLEGVVTLTGGIPIASAKGEHLGGVGVSGSSASDDESCALSGVAAIKNALSSQP